ncbi:VOC family protein, partial [Streptomyces sp. NPDC001226]
MDITLSQCFIAVDDHDKAIAFYRDVLGLEVRNDVGFEPETTTPVDSAVVTRATILSPTTRASPSRTHAA